MNIKQSSMEQPISIPEKSIVDFVSAQTVLTIATSENNFPHTALCFYAYIPEYNLIAFKSKPTTNHISTALRNNHIAGAIHPDTLNKTRIQGAQFYGRLILENEEVTSIAKKAYYKKYPFALAMAGEIWVMQLHFMKFTDNKLGIITKTIWESK